MFLKRETHSYFLYESRTAAAAREHASLRFEKDRSGLMNAKYLIYDCTAEPTDVSHHPNQEMQCSAAAELQ
jgi:hypothetical protein